MENAALFKSFLEIIQEIRTPLIFWGLLAIIGLIAFNIFSKNNDWFRHLSSDIVKNLTKSGLYKVVRIFLYMFFSVVIIFVILAFLAPILNNWIDKDYKFKDDKLGRLEKKIDVNDRYEQIIKLYEANEIEKANRLMLQVFNRSEFKDLDDRHGLLIASYTGAGKYVKAAEEIIKRDLNKPKWAFGLKADLQQCIRNYALINSLTAEYALTQELKKNINRKLFLFFGDQFLLK
jgi:hypothetical protein